ncbi:MAG: diadenylate cyclase CdaA [Phycisphaerales bacterium]
MQFDRLYELAERVQGHLREGAWEVVAEFAVIWAVVFIVYRFLRGTRGARVIKGVALILVVGVFSIQVFGREGTFERLNLLYSKALPIVSLTLIIVFQPELRRALVRLGEARLFRQTGLRRAQVIEELVAALTYLSKNKIGALIAIERRVGLRGIVELGTRLDAEVTKQLLDTIFWPGSALHDMGVVIRGDRIVAAGVQFPLADSDNVPQELGSRHRAAIGLSQEADALVLIVSEETGTISVAERGELKRGLTPDELRPILSKGFGTVTMTPKDTATPTETETDATTQGDFGK